MEPLTVHTGTAMPLRRADVDTDQIIPSDWLKRVQRTGFGAGLFSEWRERKDFVLNDDRFSDATVLVAGENFGTGSSREHAVWALTDYGFRVVVSSRFGDIFRNNSTKGGLLPVVVDEDDVQALQDGIEADPSTEVTVDLESRELRWGSTTLTFELDDYTRWRLMEGLDDIGLTLRHEEDITAFERTRPAWVPVTT